MNGGAASGWLVGRESELAAVHRLLDRAVEGPAAAVLEGEPGIGKTALWRAGVDAARARGYTVLQARPSEAERGLSFSALGDLLEPALELLDRLPPPRRRALEVALLLAPGEHPAPDARAVGLATIDLLRELAAERPLLMAIDDTQWIDHPSRDTLAYALRRLEREPISVLVACRPGGDVLGLAELERVVVGPLPMSGLRELLAARLQTMLTRPTLARVHETSGGNPFFALELVRALDGRELRPAEPLPVPATLARLTASRFERLAPGTRAVLEYVAALARPTLDVVTAAAGDEAAPALAEATAAGVIEADGPRLRFTHPLLASVHHGLASADQRRRRHRRLAEVVTDPEERARHLGAGATAPDAQVAAALDDGAAAARARAAPSAAAELAEIAVQLTPSDDRQALLRRLSAAADHHFAAASTARARTLLEAALERASRGPERARIALQLAIQLDAQDLEAELPLLEQALHEAEGETGLRAEIHHAFADYYGAVNIGESRRHAGIAFRLAERTGDSRLIAQTLTVAGVMGFWAGEGLDHGLFGRGSALEAQMPRLPLMNRPRVGYAWALKWSGDVDRAQAIWDDLRGLGRPAEDPDLIHLLFFKAYHELIAERWPLAARYAAEACALAIETERNAVVAMYRWAGAVVAAYRGQVEHARSLAVDAHRLAGEAGLPDARYSGHALGVLELSLGEPAAALAHLRPATESERSTGIREPALLLGFPEHIEAAVACGELDEADELLGFVEQHARRLDRAWARGCAARGRALLATARGDELAAENAFADAYEQHARRPQQLPTYELARTLLAHGAHLRRRQQKRRAREALERALGQFERLGAQTYAERTRSELARIGGRAAPAGDGLSETERQIADLVAQGRSNKEVAAALSLSPKTVEWNLSKVYAKLGVRSRTELAGRRR